MTALRPTPSRSIALCAVGLLSISSGCFSDPFVELASESGSSGGSTDSAIAAGSSTTTGEDPTSTTAQTDGETTGETDGPGSATEGSTTSGSTGSMAGSSTGDDTTGGEEATGSSTGVAVDCEGTPGGDAELDVCEVCNGDGTSCLDCEGTPNGGAELDVCEVCNGDGTSCLDCEGTPNGDAELDICEVCNGDGTSCLDCEGTPNGGAELDVCEVCNGDGTSCLDCEGTPNGDAELDVCDVCNGDGTSCLDCDGTPNGDAELDECGVCGGIGAPCWGCTVPSASNYDPLATLNDGTCSCNTAPGVISDQSNLSSNAGAGGTDQWQSFTVGFSGGLTRVDMAVSSPLLSGSSPGTLRIYEGEGFSGTLLGTQDVTLEDVFNTMQEFDLDDAVPMTAGAVYSFRLTVPTVQVGFVTLNTSNPYAGGRASSNASWDLVFQTHVSQCLPE